MPDRVLLMFSGVDKYQFFWQLVASLLLLCCIGLTIALLRIKWKIKVLVKKLKILEDIEMKEILSVGAEQEDKQMEKEEEDQEMFGTLEEEGVYISTDFPGEEAMVDPKEAGLYIMSSQQAAFLMQRIRTFMEKDKPYLDPKFNMNKLCDAMGINRTYLSSAINQNTGQRFETFINTYRISDAVDLLSAEESSQYTLEYLASKVGFQSKSTFNRSFKQFTGINPSFFQRVILQDRAARKFFFDYFDDLKNRKFTVKK